MALTVRRDARFGEVLRGGHSGGQHVPEGFLAGVSRFILVSVVSASGAYPVLVAEPGKDAVLLTNEGYIETSITESAIENNIISLASHQASLEGIT